MVKNEIRTINLKKTYCKSHFQVNALVGATFSIKKGDYVSIVGTSGSGKSTLMHLIGCLDQPTSGKLLIDNTDVSRLSDEDLAKIRRKKLGFIFQKYNLISTLNARENVELSMRFAGVNKRIAEKRAEEFLISVGLEKRIFHKPTELSGGEQQRVAIARALSNNPSIILGDEPTGNLDTKSGLKIMKILEKINKEGKTVIIVTHDQSIAKRSRRYFSIKDGVVREDYAS